jgi:hypothetical protein
MHEERCPYCGRFVENDAVGFYDRLEPDNDGSLVACFCDERCAERYHARRSQ